MKIINIGGAQNSGKSTVSKMLNARLPNSIFIEVDDLLSDEEHNALPDMKSKIAAHLGRLYERLEKLVSENKYDYMHFCISHGNDLLEQDQRNCRKFCKVYCNHIESGNGGLSDKPRHA